MRDKTWDDVDLMPDNRVYLEFQKGMEHDPSREMQGLFGDNKELLGHAIPVTYDDAEAWLIDPEDGKKERIQRMFNGEQGVRSC